MDTNYETYEEILEMPVLALRNVVAMPQTSIFIEAARKASISAVSYTHLDSVCRTLF